MKKILAAVSLLALVLTLAPASGSASASSDTRPKWHTRVFASVPSPGFPAYVFKHPNGRVYAATYTNPRGDSMRSRVFEWSGNGALLRSWTVPGQDLSSPRGVQVATADAKGRLVLLEKSTGRVLRLDITTGRFTAYSKIIDLPNCSTGRRPCSPSLVDAAGIPNYAAWLPGGALLVTDYAQAVIWKVPRGGGAARVWMADKRLDGTNFGATGIVLTPDRRSVLLSQQGTLDPLAPGAGKLYRIGVRSDGSHGALSTLWTSRPGDLPDGFGIGISGRIYLANAGLSAQLVVLSPRGAELERFPKTPVTGDNGSPVPFDTPSNATFHGTRVLVANQSFIGDRSHHVILDVEVGERGAPVLIPATAGSSR